MKFTPMLKIPMWIFNSIFSLIETIMLIGFDAFANTAFSPALFFLYPYYGIRLLFGDSDHYYRDRMVAGYKGEDYADSLIAWTHMLIYQAKSML